MTNHPNRNWRRRWKLTDANTVDHESGLRVRFDADGNGDALGVIPSSDLPRLLREAGEFYSQRFS